MEPHDEEHALARVHLVNPLWDASGGSDWRTIDTWRLLRPHADVRMWSEYSPAPAFAHYAVASFERVVLIYNADQPDRLAKYVERLERAGHRVDIIYTSRALRHRHRGRGRVLESPIDVQRFRPWRIVRPARPFTVGRLSRDIRSKHHEDDPRLWRRLHRRAVACA